MNIQEILILFEPNKDDDILVAQIFDREIEMITNDIVSICRNTTEGFRHKALHKINPDPDQVKLNEEKSGISLLIWPAELHPKTPSKGPSDIPTIENICVNEVTANCTNDNSHSQCQTT